MKKIFLTSGIIACMACPAFADNPTGFSVATVNTAQQRPSPDTGIVDNACVVDIIGVTSGETTLEAQWLNNFSTITLNPNTANNGYGSGTLAPTPIYGVPQDTYVYAGQDSTGTLTTPRGLGQGDTATVLTGTVTGKTVEFTPTASTQYSSASTVASMSVSGASSTTPNRAFLGLFADATDDATDSTGAYIDASGAITSAGITAAAGLSAGGTATWYAKYNCATPSMSGTPTMTGYDFQGWSMQDDGTVDQTLICIRQDTPVYPVFAKHTYEVTYECGTEAEITAGAAFNSNLTLTEGSYILPAEFDSPFTHAGANTCVFPGHTFAGWSCTVAAESNHADNANWTTASATKCTATWDNETITLHWNNNGTVTDDTCSYTGSVSLPANPTRTGWIFNGWAVNNTVSQQSGGSNDSGSSNNQNSGEQEPQETPAP